jgi:hypothetical protein
VRGVAKTLLREYWDLVLIRVTVHWSVGVSCCLTIDAEGKIDIGGEGVGCFNDVDEDPVHSQGSSCKRVRKPDCGRVETSCSIMPCLVVYEGVI